MSFTTVGELINALSKLNRATPVLREDITGNGYFDVDTSVPMLFKVVFAGTKTVEGGVYGYYTDADTENPDGFDAIVL
jgi:hypothetical protein